jgi:hypothetical protein
MKREAEQRVSEVEREKAAARAQVEAEVRGGSGSREAALEAALSARDLALEAANAQLRRVTEEHEVLLAQLKHASDHTTLLTSACLQQRSSCMGALGWPPLCAPQTRLIVAGAMLAVLSLVFCLRGLQMRCRPSARMCTTSWRHWRLHARRSRP